jgi:small-conductance mechanosensitive channel
MIISRHFFSLLISVGLWAQTPPVPSSEAQLKPSIPVVFKGETIFEVKTRIGSFTPEARARAITERLERIVSDPFHPLPPLQAANQEQSTDILCGETILLTLTEEDAHAEGISRERLAQQRIAQIQPVLQAQTWRAKLKSLALSTLWTLLVTAGGFGVFRGVRFGFGRFGRSILAISEESFLRFKIQNLELVSSARMRQLSLKGITLIQGAALLLLGYIYLSIIFSFFPVTKGLAAQLFQLIMEPLKVVFRAMLGYLPNLFFLLLIALVTRYLLKLVHLIFRGIQSGALNVPNFHQEWAEPTYRLIRVFVFAFALVVAFPYLPGAGSDAFKGVSLFIGLVFSLGSSGLVGNAVAGILITYMRPFQLGDRIAVGETVGDVTEKSLLVTRIRTIKNVDVTIPNATLLGGQVHNYSANAQTRGLILHSTITIGYDAPWRTVHALLIEAANQTEGLLKEPKPFVLQTSLDDFYVSYQINAYTDQASRMATIYSELHANIQEQFNQAGVEIMSPHYRSERDGNQTTIPAQHLPEDYVAPAFRVKRI